MEHRYDYLIIGAGMSGESAAQALHDTEPTARIGMLGAETYPPYDRPPLTKSLWKDATEDSIWRPLAKSGAHNHPGRRAVSVDADAHTVTDAQGDIYIWRKLLFATGGEPRRLPFDGDRVLHYRTLDDYHRLRTLARSQAHIAVVGGGFIGSEIAAALTNNDCRVTLVFPEAILGERTYPQGLAQFIHQYYQDRGVELVPESRVTGGEQRDERVHVRTGNDKSIEADAVVAGLGITPRTGLAEQAGASVDNGVVVDACMRSSVPDIFAAGDIANFPTHSLGHLRVEHENAAVSTGRHAGLAMAGKPEPYTELPYFYSDLFDLGYEAVGRLDSRMTMIEDWRDPNREGVVYYLENDRVCGVLLWNTWDQVEAARELIADPGPHDADSLRGRIPEAD